MRPILARKGFIHNSDIIAAHIFRLSPDPSLKHLDMESAKEFGADEMNARPLIRSTNFTSDLDGKIKSALGWR
jgi:hypothetical protein